MKMMRSPCDVIMKKFPSNFCISESFSGWLVDFNSCSSKCKLSKDNCCVDDCMYPEFGRFMDKVDKDLLLRWLRKTGDPEEHQILEYINSCEAISSATYFEIF